MNENRYQKAFDQIPIPAEAEERILQKIQNRQSGRRQNRRKITRLLPTFCAAAVLILLAFRGTTGAGLLSGSSLKQLNYVSQIRKKQYETEDQKAELTNVSVRPGQLLILDTDMNLKKGETALLTGTASQEDCQFEIGFIHDGNYEALNRYSGSSRVTETISSGEDGEYSFCITNLSSADLSFRGTIELETDHLIYYANSVYLREGVTITVDLKKLKQEQSIAGCFLQNCETGEIYDILNGSGDGAGCRIGESGSYKIFAITDEGTCLDLSDKIGIEYSLKDQSGVLPLQEK